MDLTQITNELLTIAPTILLQIFVLAVVLDIISGFLAAKITGNFSSREATNGIMRQGSRMLFFIAAQFAMTLVSDESSAITLALTTFQVAMIVGYVVSLKENYQKINQTERIESEEL